MFSGILPVSLLLCKVSVRFPTEQDTQDESPKGRTRQHIRDRLVYNVWGLYSFVQMLIYKCLRFGKALSNQHISYV